MKQRISTIFKNPNRDFRKDTFQFGYQKKKKWMQESKESENLNSDFKDDLN